MDDGNRASLRNFDTEQLRRETGKGKDQNCISKTISFPQDNEWEYYIFCCFFLLISKIEGISTEPRTEQPVEWCEFISEYECTDEHVKTNCPDRCLGE